MSETHNADAADQVNDSLGNDVQSKFSAKLKENFAKELLKKKLNSTVSSELIAFVEDLSLGQDDLKSIFIKSDHDGVCHD